MSTDTTASYASFSDLFPVHPKPYMHQPYQISSTEDAEAGAAESDITYNASTIDLAWYPSMNKLTHRWVFKGDFDPAGSFVNPHTSTEGGKFSLDIKVDVVAPGSLMGGENLDPVLLHIQPDSSSSPEPVDPASIKDWVSSGRISLIEPLPTIERKTYPDNSWIRMRITFPYRTISPDLDESHTTFSATVQQGEQPAVAVQAEVRFEATCEWFE